MICFSDSQQEVEYSKCFQKAFKFNLNMFLNNQIGFVGSIVFGKLEVLLCTTKETFIYIYIFFSCLVILKKDLNIFTKCHTSKYNLCRSDKLAIPHHITAFTENQVYSYVTQLKEKINFWNKLLPKKMGCWKLFVTYGNSIFYLHILMHAKQCPGEIIPNTQTGMKYTKKNIEEHD